MNNMLAGVFNPQQTVILIVVSVIGVLLIILNVVLAIIFHRRGERKLFSKLLQQQRELYLKQLAEMRSNPEFSSDTTPYKPFFNMGAPVEAIPQEQPEEVEDVVMVDEDQDVVDEVIVDGQVVRYNRSFLARLIQASDLLKNRYSDLKNQILSYKGVKDKISWKKETFRVGRKTLVTFVIRGKTLCLCMALDPKQFEDTKYKVDDLSVRSPKSKTPCLYRISNDRRFRYAKELIDMLFIENQIEKLEHTDLDYTLSIPFETTEALIGRDLIRIVGAEAGNPDFTLEKPTPVEEPVLEVQEEVVAEAPVVEELIETEEAVEVEDEVEETQEEALEDMDEEAEVFEEVIVNGIVVRYNRSFEARLSQGTPALNARYSELKNYMLSYKGVKNRISWKKETFNRGRNNLAVFVVRGKNLCLCLALDPKQLEGTKYKVKDLSIRSPKSKTPCLYRLSNDRRVKYAKELIDLLFAQQFELEFKEKEMVDFTIPYATTEELIERELIRVNNKSVEETVVAVEETLEAQQEETVVETPVEEPAAEVQEEITETTE